MDDRPWLHPEPWFPEMLLRLSAEARVVHAEGHGEGRQFPCERLVGAHLRELELAESTVEGLIQLSERATRERSIESMLFSVGAGETERHYETWIAVQGDEVVALVRDVTWRLRADAAAADREARLEAILSTAVDGIVTINELGTILSFNRSAVRIFGYQAEEVVGLNVTVLMPEEERALHDGFLRRYLEERTPRIIGIGREVLGRRRNGEQFPMELAVSESLAEGHRFFTGIVRDISDRRRAEERAAGFGRILDDSLNEIYIFSGDTLRFLHVNRGARENLGYSMGELLGMTLLDLQPEMGAEQLFEQLPPGGERHGRQFASRFCRKDGTRYEVEVHLHRSTFDALPVVVAIVLDVTERRRTEEQLLQNERLAAIGQTMAGLAHESRNAFQRSQACLEMLAIELEGQPEPLELVQRVQRALDHVHHLHEEVRDYAAPIMLDRQSCDLGLLWRDAWSQLELSRANGDYRLEDQHAAAGSGVEGTSLLACVDWFALGQVFRILLENALAACGSTGTVTIRAEDGTLRERPALRIHVRDTGPGVPASQRSQVFLPFFTTKVKGTGLGLAIAQRIIEAHRGTIELGPPRSGGGAEFVITLPRE